MTWEARTLEGGRKEFIIVFVPMNDFWAHHDLRGTDGMIKASSKGVVLVKELTTYTCEWTR